MELTYVRSANNINNLTYLLNRQGSREMEGAYQRRFDLFLIFWSVAPHTCKLRKLITSVRCGLELSDDSNMCHELDLLAN
jgi:hypothetical protein